MKAHSNKNKSITVNMTRDEFYIISAIINRANDTCFEEQDADGDWYSNDDFVVSLSDEQRQMLRKICELI